MYTTADLDEDDEIFGEIRNNSQSTNVASVSHTINITKIGGAQGAQGETGIQGLTGAAGNGKRRCYGSDRCGWQRW